VQIELLVAISAQSVMAYEEITSFWCGHL